MVVDSVVMSLYLSVREKRIETKSGVEMKVLMVISQFHPIIGGAEKQANSLRRPCIEKGIQSKHCDRMVEIWKHPERK